MTLTSDIRKAIRITTADFDTEIKMYIEACRLDLQDAGVPKEVADSIEDPLVKSAIVMYVQAMFGLDDGKRESNLAVYEKMKISLKNANHQLPIEEENEEVIESE